MGAPQRYSHLFGLMLLGGLLASLALRPQPITRAAPPAGFPLALSEGPRPTINLSSSSGYAGQAVTVSGQGHAGFAAVRVAWVLDDRTLTLAEAPLAGDGSYQAELIVPTNLPAGPSRVCAALNGAATASFACAPFAVDEPPPGQVSGSIPLASGSSDARATAAINAEFRLLDAAGATVASAPIGADGRFNLPDVLPGTYRYAVSGEVPVSISSGILDVPPGTNQVIRPIAKPPANACELLAQDTPTTLLASPSRAQFDLGIVQSGVGIGAVQKAGKFTPFDVNFGIYISGVDLNVTFEALPQLRSGQTLRGVDFVIDPDGPGASHPLPETLVKRDTLQPFTLLYNVKDLPPGRARIYAKPIIDGESCPGVGARDIDVIPNPLSDPRIVPGSGQIAWNDARQRYEFAASLPNPTLAGQQVLPARFDTRELPYLGKLSSSLSLALRVEGSMDLEGAVRTRLVMPSIDASVLGVNPFAPQGAALSRQAPRPSADFPLLPPDFGGVNNPNNQPRNLSIDLGRHTLFEFQKELFVAKVPVFSFFGIINVGVQIRVGVGGQVVLEGTLFPLRPEFYGYLSIFGFASLSLGVYVDALGGLAEAGADARISAGVDLLLNLEVGPSPQIGLSDPCIAIKLRIRAYVSYLWGLGSEDTTRVVIDEPCPGVSLPLQNDDALPPAPRVIASPALASAADGRMLAAYIEDASPTEAIPSPRVIARLSDPATGAWGPPVAISDPAHTVQSPAVAFVGPDHTPVIVWAENTLTQAEGEALGKDIASNLPNQELFYAQYQNDAWSAPQRITDDRAADGKPVLAGDEQGATLGWVRDLDGDIATPGDVRIAVAQWLDFRVGGRWSTPMLLNGAGADASSGYNAQVSVARSPDGVPALAWIYDADGNMGTGSDRRIALATSSNEDWVLLNPQPLPPRVDSPSIAFDGQVHRLSFLVRESEGAAAGLDGALWTASNAGGDWSAAALKDEAGQPVYAELPRLRTNKVSGETLLVFRRFGTIGTNAQLGQLALSQISSEQGVPPSPPLYITDEPRQNALPALAFNPADGTAQLLRVARSTAGDAGLQARGRRLRRAPQP
jgi:hypothetical protein